MFRTNSMTSWKAFIVFSKIGTYLHIPVISIFFEEPSITKYNTDWRYVCLVELPEGFTKVIRTKSSQYVFPTVGEGVTVDVHRKISHEVHNKR